ncbi:hypothetical protein COV05_00580 [Candidatus Uhrbacteria bacterium CG10_big_fil_rev_8_21_14_0_10_48_16]|uniref:Uncharacterized protein n=1 Tax=Candidatus Uhrbacteria bacterium CG10_big_fil_rev_8_21_14_0_10_48_16 TaxID=1975038 RepID=A0A2M8LI24_9BACT|nr:MAG: hypothetical protein COV05_00580 [Candidatus Uhrbacteria bacterium CG10_big_fil_rev_8_21_14_0_10_48_16]
MRQLIPHPLSNTPEALMNKAGYVRHCVETGRACYHRRLNDPPFPRFHAYVSTNEKGMEIDLHFDALDSITHKGNHDQTWAYEGGRVNEEANRILTAICGQLPHKEIYHAPGHPLSSSHLPTKKKKSLFEILFKTM